MGRVLSFTAASESKGLNFDDQQSSDFASALLNGGNQVFLDRVKSRLESSRTSAGISASASISDCKSQPELFANRLQVVKFGDISIDDAGNSIRIGMSATVCKGSRKSKIWTRISTDDGEQSVTEASDVLDKLCALADIVCDEMSAVYHDQLKHYLSSISSVENYGIDIQHVFLMEVGDYNSAKLFDTITTLRETASFFSVHDEGDWTPLSDLFEFASSRLSPDLGLTNLSVSDNVTDPDIIAIADFFNSESKALTWDVTLGRHGLFAVDEMTSDPQTGSSRTHMVGLCASHIQPNPRGKPLSSSWLVSGSYAPRLGATF